MRNLGRPFGLLDPNVTSFVSVCHCISRMYGVLGVSPVFAKPGLEAIDRGRVENSGWQRVPVVQDSYAEGVPPHSGDSSWLG